MSAPQAVRVQTEGEYNKVIEVLKGMGLKPIQSGEGYNTTFTKRFITIEDRYMQLCDGSKLLADKGYKVLSFEEFIGGQNHV